MAEEKRVYNLDDFHTPDPFDELLHLSPFDRIDRLGEIEKDAKDSGYTVKLFRQRWKEYQKAHGETLRGENLTEFTGQPLQLCCGGFTANDYGISLNGLAVCSTPVVFSRRLRNIESGTEKWILSHAGYGKWEELPPIPASDFGSPQKLLSLKDYGVAVDSNRAKNLAAYLTTIDEQNRDFIPVVESVGHCGWLKDGSFFPYYDNIHFDGNPEFLPMVKAICANTRFESGVNDYTWVRKVQEIKNRSIEVRLALDATFAAPLISMLNALIFVVHLWGDTGNGKSTTLQLCASVWGDPDKLTHSCATTQTSLELRCGTLKNLPLIADETQLLKGNRGNGELGIYQLTQGRGRERATQTLGIRQTETWANTILTAGETPLVSSDSSGGEINRVLQLECRPDYDLIENPGEIKGLIKDCHGHAGKRFVEFLSENMEDVRSLFQTCQQDIRQSVDTTGKQVLMLSVLLLTDILVTQLFFPGDKPLDPVDLKPFAISKESLSDGRRGYEYILDFVARNGSHFKGDAVLEDYGEFNGSTVYIIKSVFDKILKDAGFNPTKVLSWMAQRGKVERGKDRNTRKVRIRGVSVWCVAILDVVNGMNEQQE